MMRTYHLVVQHRGELLRVASRCRGDNLANASHIIVGRGGSAVHGSPWQCMAGRSFVGVYRPLTGCCSVAVAVLRCVDLSLGLIFSAVVDYRDAPGEQAGLFGAGTGGREPRQVGQHELELEVVSSAGASCVPQPTEARKRR